MNVDAEFTISQVLPKDTISDGSNQAYFEAVIGPLMPALLAYFVRRVVPSHEGADCLSETLVVLWNERRKLPADESSRRSWAFGVARNILLNHRRGHVRRQMLANRIRDEILVTPLRHPAEGAGELIDSLTALPDTQRELVQLIIWDGFGVAEAGALIGLRPGTARAAYARAKKHLRKVLP